MEQIIGPNKRFISCDGSCSIDNNMYFEIINKNVPNAFERKKDAMEYRKVVSGLYGSLRI
jgi:hypothetical protein